MDTPFLCPDCGIEHDEPGEARLGHLVRCPDCALSVEIIAFQAEFSAQPPAVAA
ncbi:MAG: hypothetical protein WCE44_04630 [Candidatus Velthaea sp.]|jgi:hypothetical protein